MKNVELIKLINKIGIKEYNNKIIFFNANKVFQEMYETMYKEEVKKLCNEYIELRNQKKLDNYNLY